MSSDGCKHEHVHYDNHSLEFVCECCGMVAANQDDLMNSGGEIVPKPIIDLDSPMIRYGRIADFTNGGILSTIINNSNRDYAGNILNPINKNNINRIRLVNKYVNSKKNNDVSYKNAMHTITVLCDKLYLPLSLKDRAAILYHKAFQKNAVKGRSAKAIAAAAVFYSCRESEIIRDVMDIVNALHEESDFRNELFAHYRILMEVLELNAPSVVDPTTEIPRVSSKLRLSDKTKRKAIYLYKKLYEHNNIMFFGKSTSAIAACFLYIASKYTDEYIRQENVHEVTDVSTVTLRKRCEEYIEILKSLNEPIPGFFNGDGESKKRKKKSANRPLENQMYVYHY